MVLVTTVSGDYHRLTPSHWQLPYLPQVELASMFPTKCISTTKCIMMPTLLILDRKLIVWNKVKYTGTWKFLFETFWNLLRNANYSAEKWQNIGWNDFLKITLSVCSTTTKLVGFHCIFLSYPVGLVLEQTRVVVPLPQPEQELSTFSMELSSQRRLEMAAEHRTEQRKRVDVSFAGWYCYLLQYIDDVCWVHCHI